MKRLTLAALACTTTLLGVTACNDDNNHSPPGTGEVRLVNGIPDSGSITASATSGVSNTPGVEYGAGSSTVDVPIGSYNVQLKNGTTTDPFFTVNNTQVDHNSLTVLWTSGSIAAGTGSGFPVEINLGSSSSGKFTFEFVNDTTQDATSSLNIYLVASGTAITADTTPVATVAAGKASAEAEVASGTYQIVVSASAAPTLPLYASPSTVTLAPSGSNVVQIGAIDNNQSTTDCSPIALMILDNGNNDADENLVRNVCPAAP